RHEHRGGRNLLGARRRCSPQRSARTARAAGSYRPSLKLVINNDHVGTAGAAVPTWFILPSGFRQLFFWRCRCYKIFQTFLAESRSALREFFSCLLSFWLP